MGKWRRGEGRECREDGEKEKGREGWRGEVSQKDGVERVSERERE